MEYPSDDVYLTYIDESFNIVGLFSIALGLLGEDPYDKTELVIEKNSFSGKTRYENATINNMMISIYQKMIDCHMQILNNKLCSYERRYSEYRGYYYAVNLYPSDSALQTRRNLISTFKENIKAIQNQNEIIKRKRIEEYWRKHPEEKEKWETEKTSLEQIKQKSTAEISELQKSKEKVPSLELLVNKQKEIEALEAQKKTLGLFKFKERKALQEKIEVLIDEKYKIKTIVTAEQQEIEKQITPIRAELNKTIARIKEIDNELTMDRDEEEEDDE